MIGLGGLKRALQKLGDTVKPRAERRPATGLTARFGPETPTTPAGIKDISASGIYLVTEKRLRTGELITLTLQEEGEAENSSEMQISVQARVARQGEGGVGLSFVLPPGLDIDLWGVLVRNIVILNEPDQIAQMFRTLRTILFLCRICQAGAEESIVLLGGHLDADRTETLVKIAQGAENQIAAEANSDRMRADPKLVANILHEGSWTNDELTRQLWSGLLVSSCSPDVPDDGNQIFAKLLVHMTPVQAKIFVHACEKAIGAAAGAESPDSVVLSPKEMIELTGWSDLTRNATDTAYLFNLGLLGKLFDFTSYQETAAYDITPSQLGIELYRHCRGQRGKIGQDLVASAKEHLQNFLPAAQPMAVSNQKPHYTYPDPRS